MRHYQNILNSISYLSNQIIAYNLERGLSHAETQDILKDIIGCTGPHRIQTFLQRILSRSQNQITEGLIGILGLLELQYRRQQEKDGDFPSYHIENKIIQESALYLVQQPRFEVLQTPRKRKNSIINQSHGEEPKGFNKWPKWDAMKDSEWDAMKENEWDAMKENEFDDDLIDTEVPEENNMDRFEKSIQETLEKTKKLRKLLDSQLEKLKSRSCGEDSDEYVLGINL